MCGISGSFGKCKLEKNIIYKTLDLMKNRGPDNQNFIQKEKKDYFCSLLHSRLSIIDLNARSNQPFKIGPFILIFNGEIYNYLELRDTLKKNGIICKTKSDTEVLLNCYILFKEKSFNMFEGMFSIAIFNENDFSLTLIRDKFGEKPLYYYRNKNDIFFGSETKFVRSISNKKFILDSKKINNYLFLGYKSLFKTNNSFFQNIKQIKSGSGIIIEKNKIKKFTYWKPKLKKLQKVTLNDAIENSKKLLTDSIRLRLRSDVPIAVCLSGGIDSTAIASIARKKFNSNIKCYSIIDRDQRYNEELNIKATIQDLNCEYELINLNNKNFINNLKNLIKYHDAPISTITSYNYSLLASKISKDKRKISLSGTAADEIYGGYYDHYLLHLAEIFDDKELFEINKKNWEKSVLPNVRNKLLRNSKLYIDNKNFRDHIFDNSEKFLKFSRNSIDSNFYEKKYNNSLMKNRMLNELFNEITPVILNQDDLNSMMYSIENRSPFLDTNLFNYINSLPSEFYIKNGMNKYILRESLKGIVNEKVINDNVKKGFNGSINSLINFNDSDICSYLFNENSPINEIVNVKKISKNLPSDKNFSNSWSKFLFNFVNLKIFLENHID